MARWDSSVLRGLTGRRRAMRGSDGLVIGAAVRPAFRPTSISRPFYVARTTALPLRQRDHGCWRARVRRGVLQLLGEGWARKDGAQRTHQLRGVFSTDQMVDGVESLARWVEAGVKPLS